MNENTEPDGTQVASDALRVAQKAAAAADPERSAFSRVSQATGAVTGGVRLAPAAWRIVQRYPIVSALLLVGFAYLVYRAPRNVTTSDALDG